MSENYNQEWWVAERLAHNNKKLINKGNKLLDKYYHKNQEQREQIKK